MRITDYTLDIAQGAQTYALGYDLSLPEGSRIGRILLDGSSGGVDLEGVSFWDEKTQGVDGGTFTSGADRIRDINQLWPAVEWVSLADNQITLQPGTYFIWASAPAHMVDQHYIYLWSVTDGSVLKWGTSEKSHQTYRTTTVSIVFTIVDFSTQETIEIHHRCIATRNTDGFGDASNIAGHPEIYSQGFILKLT